MLTDEERRTILEDWNRTEHSWSTASFQELFEAQVDAPPDLPAAVFNGVELSYREMNERANKVAHYIRSLGICPEALVAICVERSFEMLVGIVGILKAGGAYLPLDPAYPRERIAMMLRHANPSAVLTAEQLCDRLPLVSTPILRLDSEWQYLAGENGENPAPLHGPQNAAYVL